MIKIKNLKVVMTNNFGLAWLLMAFTTWSNPNSAPSVDTAMVNRIQNSELGLSLSGKARSTLLQSALSGKSVALDAAGHENIAFSRADIEFIARPSANTQGHLKFRIHQDWNKYYDEGPNPLLARWFDFGGNLAKGKIEFAIGDFREKISPLSLYAPEPELLYEPEIFKQRRQLAMGEWFLGENKLPLQGLHAKYQQSLSPSLTLGGGANLARLRSAASSSTGWLFWADDVEKILGTGSLNVRAWDALEIGGTYIQITDNIPTSRSVNNQYIKLTPTALYENVNVKAVSLSLDGARFLNDKNLFLRLDAEIGLSNYARILDTKDTVNNILKLDRDPELAGKAFIAGLHGGYTQQAGLFALTLNLAYLNNEAGYVNDVAQSPTFLGNRILNSRTSTSGFNGGYHTLDALYNYVYSVDPVTNINTSEYWFADTKVYNGTNNWYRAASFKNSYTPSTTSKAERDALVSANRLDPHVQLLLPFGPATPNRQGLNLDLTTSLMDKKIEVTGLFASLKEIEGSKVDTLGIMTPREFSRLGGGLKLQAGEMLALNQRITLAGSYVIDSRKQPAYALVDTSYGPSEFKSSLLGTSLYAGLWKGIALLAGYQNMGSNPLLGYATTAKSKMALSGDLTQSQWSVGLELKITYGAYVIAEYGKQELEETQTSTLFSQDLMSLNMAVGF